MMIEEKKKEGAVEYCVSLLDAYVNTLKMEDGFEILGPIQYDAPELVNYMLGCMICAWMESDVNLNGIKEQVESNYNVEISDENIENMLFSRVYVKAKRFIEARDAEFKSRIPTFDMLTDKYGEKSISTSFTDFWMHGTTKTLIQKSSWKIQVVHTLIEIRKKSKEASKFRGSFFAHKNKNKL